MKKKNKKENMNSINIKTKNMRKKMKSNKIRGNDTSMYILDINRHDSLF